MLVKNIRGLLITNYLIARNANEPLSDRILTCCENWWITTNLTD